MNPITPWIQAIAIVVSTFMAYMSIRTALKGVRLNAQLHRERIDQDLGKEERQRLTDVAARKAEYYQMWVVQPLQAYITKFIATVQDELSTGIAQLNALRAAGDHNALTTGVRLFQNRFVNYLEREKWGFTVGIQAVRATALATQVSAIFRGLEDGVLSVVSKWALDPDAGVLDILNFQQLVSSHVDSLAQAATEHDPELNHRQSTPVVPKAQSPALPPAEGTSRRLPPNGS